MDLDTELVVQFYSTMYDYTSKIYCDSKYIPWNDFGMDILYTKCLLKRLTNLSNALKTLEKER